MNLWIFNHYAGTPDMPGGTRHYDLSKELVKRGHQVVIFASGFHHNLHKEMKLARRETWKMENIDGVKFVWLRTRPYQRNDWRRIVNMLDYMIRSYTVGRRLPNLRSGISRPNIIIGSSVHLLAVLSAYFLAKHFKASFFMEVRDLWPQTLVDMKVFGKRHPLVWMLGLLEKYLYRRALRIIVLPPKATNYIVNLGIDSKKIVWIPNGVDLSRFASVEDSTDQDDIFKVMYTGSHSPSSGLEVLLKAAKLIQDYGYGAIRFSLIGGGSEKPKLIRMKGEMNLNNVEFCKPIPKSEIPRRLLEADALLHIELEFASSKYGGSPNKLFDYMATGKPIIYASNFVRDMLDKIGCGLYVPPEDAQALAGVIVRLYKMSPEERKEMGARGKEYVMLHHSISVLADRLEDCINVRAGKETI